MRYGFIKAERANYPVTVLCRVMEVGRSAFYEWLRTGPDMEEAILINKVRRIHETRQKKAYGTRRISRELKDEGWDVGRYRARSLMKKARIEALQKKKFRYTTDSDHPLPLSPNHLDRKFDVRDINAVWCADITFLWTEEGWMYLAVVIDLASRRIVGWAMSKRITKHLVIDALRKAFLKRRPKPGLLFHSDRGAQYAAAAFRRLLKSYGMKQSMSRKANCWDNAVVERFFRTINTELTNWKRYKTREQASTDVFDYIEMFYNPKRLHSYLGYKSPLNYEKQVLGT